MWSTRCARAGRPAVVGSYTGTDYITGVAGHRGDTTSTAFLAENSDGLAVVEFADPASPIEIARLTWPPPDSTDSGVEEFIYVYVRQEGWGCGW